MQLFNKPAQAPPPDDIAVLAASVQLLSVPEYAPPPKFAAELAMIRQFVTSALVDSLQTPPPSAGESPLVRVNPLSTAPLVR